MEGRLALHNQIRNLKAQGKTIVLASHDMAEVEALCDRIAIIKGGRLVKMGTTASVVGDESLEQVFLELAQEGGAHA